MLPKRYRLNLRSQSDIFHSKPQHSRWFLVWRRINRDIATSQATVVVSKKVAPQAVRRNFLKRRIRAALAQVLPQLQVTTQFVIVLKSAQVGDMPFTELVAALRRSLELV